MEDGVTVVRATEHVNVSKKQNPSTRKEKAMRALKLLFLVCIYFLGVGLSFAKPDLEGGVVITQRKCEDYTKTVYICTMVYKNNKRYMVIQSFNGEHQIWELVGKEWIIVWSRHQA